MSETYRFSKFSPAWEKKQQKNKLCDHLLLNYFNLLNCALTTLVIKKQKMETA